LRLQVSEVEFKFKNLKVFLLINKKNVFSFRNNCHRSYNVK
jgi:hypothetical protein